MHNIGRRGEVQGRLPPQGKILLSSLISQAQNILQKMTALPLQPTGRYFQRPSLHSRHRLVSGEIPECMAPAAPLHSSIFVAESKNVVDASHISHQRIVTIL